MSRPKQAKATGGLYWLKTFRMGCGDDFRASPELLPGHHAIMNELVLVLILAKIFVCSDFQCDLDLPKGMMLL